MILTLYLVTSITIEIFFLLPLQNLNRSYFFSYDHHLSLSKPPVEQRSNESFHHDFLIFTVISAGIEQFRDSTGMPSLAQKKNPQFWRRLFPRTKAKWNRSVFFSTFLQCTQTRNHRRPVRLCVRPAGTPRQISEYQFRARDRDRPS